ncbi:MAG: hypothetical protein QF760_02815 [Candidatus Thalassarchaeaceae archaeon]|jgi:hypothetical protein|nr:hypothetical protein [Candidatus Thalassarchaeaceae archaeon]MDP6703439.1 hypothetical protein [Candidatus Thalassarchaeaceae archaeon]MDP7004394.1 hypothetical protein [Candidatus Thalassarchaeaceae archaeon]
MAEQDDGKGPVDTSNLYEGKVVRSSAPSRRKAAGTLKKSTDIPEDAVPEVLVPSWVETIFGGPVVAKRDFLSPDRMVVSLQVWSSATLLILCFLTFMLTPVSGTAWFAVSNIIGIESLGVVIHLGLMLIGLVGGFYGVFQRDQRAILASYIALILVTIRFAGSKVEFGLSFLPEGEVIQKILLIFYAIFLVMYIEISSGIIRFSILDTSIRTGEVYVMNVNKISGRYSRALGVTPAIAGFVAMLTLFINLIVPAFVGIFDQVAANRLRESVELTSVYGVALGTILVFMIIASMFAVNLPLRIQEYLERQS